MSLPYKTALVIGATRGTGLAIAQQLASSSIKVIATGRSESDLLQAQAENQGIEFKQADCAQPEVAQELLSAYQPDLVILAGGTRPVMRPVDELSWEQFSEAWNNDTKIAFEFTKAALQLPLPKGATVVSFSSGASLAGSPLSGGYAGAKRMQTFLVSYGQREAQRKNLGIQFISVLPKQMIAGSDIAADGAQAYGSASGKTAEQFMANWDSPLTTEMTAEFTLQLLQNEPADGGQYAITGDGTQKIS